MVAATHLFYLDGLQIPFLLGDPLLVRDVLLPGLLFSRHSLAHVFQLLLQLKPLHLKFQPLYRFLWPACDA